ncbi:MAG: alternative ribosome rescue aminoacyl-tRNA hydrolase ArfB [Breznakibacter sp.]
MTPQQIMARGIEQHLLLTATRSAGPGGQNVNKVSSRIEARLNLNTCPIFSEAEKAILRQKLASRITLEGEMIITSQIHRSQLMNKEEAINRLCQLIAMALTPVKPRKATRPTKGSVERRLKSKLVKKITKQNRKKDW